MRKHTRKDLNHQEIAEAFQRLGCGVVDTSTLGGGAPDMFVAYRGAIHAVEIKNPANAYGRRGLSARQQQFNTQVGNSVLLVSSVDDVIRLIGQWAAA